MHGTPRIYNLGAFFYQDVTFRDLTFAEDKAFIFVILREKC